MRALVLLILLAVAGTAAAEEGKPAAVKAQLGASGSGSSMPVDARAPPQPGTVRPVSRDDEARRRLMVLLMMRRAAEAFPSALLRQPE